MTAPSIAIWIDPQTQAVKIEFTPQMLQPAEYGIVLSSLFAHLATMFRESNPGASDEAIMEQLLKGLHAGLSRRKDVVLGTALH